ncbi:MAG: DHA2 family efflux MFS transporter permease subunit [Neisseriaceae bacterium]|nr:DHA2 family efflux MFS transporter permease subunit [Neisseriaceae bacterium]MBP6862875.1 DHA2 family efflux MFS transporter permease subunit [Neisseriaceae bacterium]
MPTPIDQRSPVLPLLLSMVIFMQMLDTTILNTALPAIALDLNESPLNMQATIISYALTLALCIPISGYLSDRIGTKKVFLLAIGLFSLGSLLCALAPSLNLLVGARIIQGIGGAMLTPVARLALIRTYPKSELLGVLNYAIMPALLGPILGPLMGGYLVELASWHWIFLINLPIGLLSLILGTRYMPDFKQPEATFDGRGFLWFASAAFALTLGLERLTQGPSNPYAWATLVASVGLLWGYRHHAQTQHNALFPLHLFQVRTYRIGLYGNLAARLGISALPFLLPLFLQVALGYTPSQSGWLLVPMAVAGIMMKPWIKKLMYAYGYRTILISNTCLLSALIIILGFSAASLSLWGFIVLLFVMGLGNSVQFSAMNTLTLAKLRQHQTSSGNSLMAANQQLAISIGIALSAMMLSLFQNAPWRSVSSVTQAFQATFIAIGLITLATTLLFVRLHPKDGDGLANRQR